MGIPVSQMNSVIKRTFTTAVQGQGDDEEYDRQDFLKVLLYMYSKNKLVDCLSSQNVTSMDISRGGSRGGFPPKIGKNMIFLS